MLLKLSKDQEKQVFSELTLYLKQCFDSYKVEFTKLGVNSLVGIYLTNSFTNENITVNEIEFIIPDSTPKLIGEIISLKLKALLDELSA